MTPDQAATVRRTFRLVEAIQEQVAVLFYRRLFGLDPQIALRFEGIDRAGQREALIRALAKLANGLQHEDLEPGRILLEPGHAILGLPSEAREVAGTALIWALGQALGAAFSAKVEAAWRAAFDLPAVATPATAEPAGVRRRRRPAASSSRASDTPRSTPPVPPA